MVEQVSNFAARSGQLPLPLARLAARFLNARSGLERHQNAYYLWEAMLKLTGAVAIVECAERKIDDTKLRECLRNLARPSIGHWWELVRLTVPLLAESGEPGFVAVRDILLSKRTRHDLPIVAGLDAVLISKLEGRPGSRTTVRPLDLFKRLVEYRNKLAHGAIDQLPREFHELMGPALFAGLSELLERFDPLAGRRLVHVVQVTRDGSGDWLVEWDELTGPVPQRGKPIRVTAEATSTLPRPQTLYLTKGSASEITSFVALQPLAVFDEEVQDVAFLNSRNGRDRTEYLSYVTGRAFERQDLLVEQRELISRLMGIPVTTEQVAVWAAQSQATEEPQSAAAPIPIEQRIGEFELISRLGQGGMGVVYRARQASLDRQVALKCLLRPGDAKSSARFTREIHALGRVQHPNVVQVYQAGAHGDRYFYAMELIDGATLGAVCESLSARTKGAAAVDVATWTATLSTVCDETRKQEEPLLPREPVSDLLAVVPQAESKRPLEPSGRGYVEQIVELMRQTAEAIHALHKVGVIHRDIKPANIMITEDGATAVLMDLGLAQLADEMDGRLTRTREFVGTLRYASPEQLLNLPLDARTDIYSLGATLWELLTLKPLFGATAETPIPEVMNRIQTHEPESVRRYNPKIPSDLAAIVDKCLEKDARRRYVTAKDVANDLALWLDGKPVKNRQGTFFYVASKWCRRYRGRIAAITMLVLLQAAVVCGIMRFGTAPENAVSSKLIQIPAAISSRQSELEGDPQANGVVLSATAGKSSVNPNDALEAVPQPDSWAVVVGVRGTDTSSPSNRFAENDAEGSRVALLAAGFAPERIVLLTGAKASKKGILDALTIGSKQVKSPGILIFTYSGNGVTLGAEGKQCLIAADSTKEVPDSMVKWTDLDEIMRHSAASLVLGFVDGGHNGPSETTQRGIPFEISNAHQSEPEASVGWLFAMSQHQPAYETATLKNGVFSHYLNRGLGGEADLDGNHSLSALELVGFVKWETARHVREQLNSEQVPQRSGAFSDDDNVAEWRSALTPPASKATTLPLFAQPESINSREEMLAEWASMIRGYSFERNLPAIAKIELASSLKVTTGLETELQAALLAAGMKLDSQANDGPSISTQCTVSSGSADDRRSMIMRLKTELSDQDGNNLFSYNISWCPTLSEIAEYSVLSGTLPLDFAHHPIDVLSRQSPHIDPAGTQIRAAAESPYGIEVLLDADAGPKSAIVPTVNENRAIVAMELGARFVIRISNKSPRHAAVRLTCNGISLFHFSKDERLRKVPVWLVPPNSISVISGWLLDTKTSSSLLVGWIPESIFSNSARRSQGSAVTAVFSNSWLKPEEAPDDEPVTRGVATATEIHSETEYEHRVIGVPRAVVSVLIIER